jgi:competence protein ComEC
MNPHVKLFSQYPLVQLASAFSIGICASHLSTTMGLLLIAGAICSMTALIAVLKSRLRIAAWTLLSAMFFAGAVLAVQERRSTKGSAFVSGEPLTLIGVLNGPPEFARDRLYLTLRVERILINGAETLASGHVSLLALYRSATAEQEYRNLNLCYGARIRVTVTLNRTDSYRNPGVSPLSEYLDRKSYDATGVVKSAAAITRLGDASVFPPLTWLYAWRERLQRQIDSRFAPETAGILDAALLGNRYNLSRATSERFREGGTFHVLVISGLHISFIGAVVLLLIRRLTRKPTLQFLFPLTVVWGYSFAVGAEASVIRAALMFTFAGLAAVVFREATSLNALGGAALALLVHSPKEIFDPSLQLTFLSVLAIVAIAWPLLQKLSAIGAWQPASDSPYPPICSRGLKSFCEMLFWSERSWKRELARSTHHYRLFKTPIAAAFERYRVQHCLRYIFGAAVVSVAVQIVLLPQMILYFHRLSFASLILNIVVSILLAALAAVALVALLLSQVNPSLAAPLFKLANAIDWLMIHSVDPFAKLGLASLRLPEYSGWPRWVYVVYYLPLLFLVMALAQWQPLARSAKENNAVLPLVAVQSLLIAILVLHPLSGGRADGKLRIDFLDVGQGDSALVTMPDGTTLLVDGGGRPAFGAAAGFETRSIGEAVVSEYLWWRGLDRVDYVLATHADADHIDGLNDVLRNFEVRSALVARSPANDPEFARFSQTLTDTATHVETIQAGDVIRLGEVELKVLWPLPGADSANNDSVVLRLQFGARSILLTGDIEKDAERQLLASQQSLQADVVKVPHHGSKTSSTDAFVSATKPRFAIISVGQNSMFGHPHREVVERWQASGAGVLTTGRSGTITVSTDGTNLWLASWK